MRKNSVYLKEPDLKNYWYKQKLLSDPLTMSYNAGWDVSYTGYYYDTGCIDFPEENWEISYKKAQVSNNYFAYIVKKDDDTYVGYINFHWNDTNKKYECGILIEKSYRKKGYGKEALELLFEVAKKYGVDYLYDSVEKNRSGLQMFLELGFKVVNNYSSKRFNKDIEVIVVRKEI